MPFWVHGHDAVTGQPRDSLFIEVEKEADARTLATDVGMTVEAVEFVPAAVREEPPKVAVPVSAGPQLCSRCNSTRVVPKATIWDGGDTQVNGRPLQAYVNAKPDALLFRGTVYATLYARICADCGHAEIFTDGAEELYKAYRQSRSAE